MPTLPLPPLKPGVRLDAGDLPVSSSTDTLAAWSGDLSAANPAPVRDALVAGETAQQLAYEDASGYAAAQSDPLRATGEYLEEIGGYERGVNKAAGESDTSYRNRINSTPNTVDPNDIIAVVNTILAPFTNISARYSERSDGCFPSSPTDVWSCHVFAVADGGPNAVPNYPDRKYSTITNRRPMGAMINADEGGRWFFLRVPDISSIDSSVAAVFQQGSPPAPPENPPGGAGFWVGNPADGVNAQNITFTQNITQTSSSIYQSIVDAVEAIRGQGVRWTLFVDPNLTA